MSSTATCTAKTVGVVPVSAALNQAKAPWYALRVQSKLANLTLDVLSSKGFEIFLPTYTSRRRWSDRVKQVETQLFPGYLFCRFDTRESRSILTTPGMIGIVGAGPVPIPVEEHEIDAIRVVLRSGLTTREWPFLAVGSTVYVNGGPLSGLTGVLTNADKVDRLVVSVTMLQRSLAVEIDRAWVNPGNQDRRL
jgi:transcription antitermination factor NusG